MARAFRVVLLFIAIISAPWSLADGISDELRDLLGGLNTLKADFQQQVTDLDGFEVQSLKGEMTVARPGNIYWRTKPPYEQLLVADAKTLWLYDKDLEQVTVRPFMKDIANSPAMLFIGDTSDLDSQYRVSRANGEEGNAVYTLIPVDSSAVYVKLLVSFKGDKPLGMELWDSLGQITRITFSRVRINQKVKPSLFTFKIPAGVDVLYND